MSNKNTENVIYLRQSSSVTNLEPVDISTGKFKGVAYSGQPIKQHGWISNLIIDLKTLSIAKKNTPVLRDHQFGQVVGRGEVSIGENVTINGSLSSKTAHGIEVKDLADEGTDWEMSLGVYNGKMREFENETINGVHMTSGTVLENGIVREVSFTILGADMNTNAEVFNVQKKEILDMELNQHKSWAEFACGCGGTKETTPEELQKKFAESDQAVKDKEKELADLKAKIAVLEKEIADAKAASDEASRETEMKAAASEKNLKLSDESIKAASKTKEATDALLLAIKGMDKIVPAAGKQFTEKVNAGGKANDQKVNAEDGKELFSAATKLVSEGKFKTFEEALDSLTEKESA